MWFIGVEVEQETSAPPPKKILDPPLLSWQELGAKIKHGPVVADLKLTTYM